MRAVLFFSLLMVTGSCGLSQAIAADIDQIPYLGFTSASLNPALAAQQKIPARIGVVVGEVAARSPADAAGLETFDVIFQIDGKPLNDTNALFDFIKTINPGQPYKLTFYRSNGTNWIKRESTIRPTFIDNPATIKARKAAELAEVTAKQAGLIDAAMKNPVITDKDSAPVISYLNAHKQMALSGSEPSRIYFSRYWTVETGKLGFARSLRVIQHIDNSTSLVDIEGTTVFMKDVDVSNIADGKSINTDKAVLIGPLVSYETVTGANRTINTATLVDLVKLFAK